MEKYLDTTLMTVIATIILLMAYNIGAIYEYEDGYNLGYAEAQAGYAHRYPKRNMPNFSTAKQRGLND